MKVNKLWLLLLAMVAVGLMGLPAYAAHPGGTVVLKDAAGNDIAAGSSTPYSPKQTCGVCHTYEANIVDITKDHGPGTPAYTVKAPLNGVTAGYHFQQGRNISWNSGNNNAQRAYYGLAKFTSSPGMWGKY
jgi:hypothetical protein